MRHDDRTQTKAKGTGRQERGPERNRGRGLTGQNTAHMKCYLLLRKSVFFRDVTFDRLPVLW